MDIIAHKRIHNFDFDGVIHDEKDIYRLRQQYDKVAENYMRVKGYIPHYDLDPVFTIEYTTGGFRFKYTRYGIYVGKVKAQCYKGVIGTKLVPMTGIPQDRSKRSSHSAV